VTRLLLAAPPEETAMSTKKTGYYEIHGSGDPLIVLHGALGSIEMWGAHIDELARTRQVIGVDLQAHPRLLDKLGASGKKDYDWTGDVANLPPTLLVGADADYYRPSHLVEVYARLGGGLRDPSWDGSAGRSASQLAILPGTSHYDILSSPLLVAVVEPWLSRP